jgi:AraC family transcriptional regulator
VAFTPDQWAQRLSRPPLLCTGPLGSSSALLRRWKDTSPQMYQPPLDHHYVVQHLGGAKSVARSGDGPAVSTIAKAGSLSFVSVGTQFRWKTKGPIEFAHLYLAPSQLQGMAARLGRDVTPVLFDEVGCHDPLLEALFASMLTEATHPGPASSLFFDSMLETFVIKLLLDHTTASLRAPRGPELLPAFQLNRIRDFVEAHLHEPIALQDLAEVAGASVFHFSRAFRNAAGESPYQFVLRRRALRARTLLEKSDHSIETVALECGFSSPVHLSRAFARFFGTTPLRFRRRNG